MSTSPDASKRPADRIVSVLSHWLARHLDDDALRRELEEIGSAGLSAEQAEAVAEVLDELRQPNGRAGELEMVVRETLEVVALDG
jgi:hypothetical protein